MICLCLWHSCAFEFVAMQPHIIAKPLPINMRFAFSYSFGKQRRLELQYAKGAYDQTLGTRLFLQIS